MKRKYMYFAALLCLAVMFLLPSFALAAPAKGSLRPANHHSRRLDLMVFDTNSTLPIVNIDLDNLPGLSLGTGPLLSGWPAYYYGPANYSWPVVLP